MAGLVVTEEAADDHACQTVRVLVDVQVEVAYQEVGEVIFCHLVEQLVLADGVGLVEQHEDVVGITLDDQRIDLRGVLSREVVHAARPDIVHVELAAMQLPALLYATEYHACHLADLAVGVFLDHLLQPLYTTVGVALVEHAQTLDEEELRAVLSQGEALCRQFGVGSDFTVAVLLEGVVGSGIDRVFDMYAEALVCQEVGVAEQYRPVALRIVALQHCQTVVGLLFPTLTGVEQPQVIPRHVVALVVRVLPRQSGEVFLAERQVVELVLEDDTGIEESLLDDGIAGGNLLFGKGNLCQVVRTVVRVEGGTVGCGLATFCCPGSVRGR